MKEGEIIVTLSDPMFQKKCNIKQLKVPWFMSLYSVSYWGGGGGGTPYNGLYREAPPERGTFFRLQVYKRVGISKVEVFKKGKVIGHLGI